MGQEVVPNKPWDKPRLSREIQPILYSLFLHPNLRAGTFKGRVTISVNVNSTQDHISVHIKGLNVTKTRITVDNETPTEVKIKATFEHEQNEFWVIVPEEDIEPGDYKLHLEFEGKLTGKIVGFYQSVYRTANNEERRIATTKFEPTFARQAYPCFDEPNFKAKYDIELVKPSGSEYIALSNMNQISEQPNTPEIGSTTVKFRTSLPMSSYLACFIICDFDHLEPVYTNGGVPITLYARRDHVNEVQHAKTVAETVANFYVDYFKIDYPLPKLDLIAIPDFVSGAMENWGLITFRETRLLCPNDSASVANQLAVSLTVSHEIAHMWFGDLVTMKWWNDLWLNEGFATFAEYKAAAQVHPSWELDNIFVAQELYPVLKLDATLNSHPIIQPVSHPDQITEIFDGISYNKGASVIRMLESTIGEENFRKGLTAYMDEFKYTNAETKDLWNHLEKFSGDIKVSNFMDTWTKQMGFPLVTVNLKDDSVTFSQKRYLIDASASYNVTESPYNYRWEIPITFVTSASPKTIHTVWMKKTDDEVVHKLPEKVNWVKVNYHNIGYYMVNYESNVWEKLRTVLESNIGILDPADRASLLNDAFSLAESGMIPYEDALSFTRYLPIETHFTPWSVAHSLFLNLHKRLYGTDVHSLFTKYINSLIDGLKTMDWDIGNRMDYLLRTYQYQILHLGCMAGNATCLHQARTLFQQWLLVPAMKLNPELGQLIMYYGIEQSTSEEWNQLYELFLRERNPQDKLRIMRALGGTRQTQTISRYLQLGKNESVVRSQDFLTLISSTAQNPTASPIVWDFVRNEWEYLVDRYTINDRYLGNMVAAVTSHFATETRLQQMNEFFAKYPEAGAGSAARKRALERVKNNIKWRQTNVAKLRKWFDAHVEK
ncbi:glutamyl aminopeptidase-like isoform X2 [Planococcus citri]|uniref:glutamyl aminopeptidase-like isoform X2 n=1 Tax=Planococcus citri TaxID=170843 RepID=UPI0031F7687F